jgi:hypothetical protein
MQTEHREWMVYRFARSDDQMIAGESQAGVVDPGCVVVTNVIHALEAACIELFARPKNQSDLGPERLAKLGQNDQFAKPGRFGGRDAQWGERGNEQEKSLSHAVHQWGGREFG